MKKYQKIILTILIGLIIGNILYKKTLSRINNIFKPTDNYYFIQEGVYSNKSNLNEAIRNLPTSVTSYKDNKYYVYLGITKEEKIAKKLQNIYSNSNIFTYVKSLPIKSEELKNNISQYDLLIQSSKTNDEVLTIEEVVLSNYEEQLKK